MKKTRRSAYKIANNRGFTTIELIGAMIIIAVLTVAGINAISTAISNSRMSAVQTDLAGYRIPIEQCLLEHPELEQEPKRKQDKFTNHRVRVAAALDEYLEGEMKTRLKPSDMNAAGQGGGSGQSSVDRLDQAGNWIVHRKDAWGIHYRICIVPDNGTGNGLRVFVVSCGKNGETGNGDVYTDTTLNTALDSDDMFMMVQLKNGRVSYGMYGMRFGNAITNKVSDLTTTVMPY